MACIQHARGDLRQTSGYKWILLLEVDFVMRRTLMWEHNLQVSLGPD
jgi:hypothetical protein